METNGKHAIGEGRELKKTNQTKPNQTKLRKNKKIFFKKKKKKKKKKKYQGGLNLPLLHMLPIPPLSAITEIQDDYWNSLFSL